MKKNAKHTILIVDDHPMLRERLAQVINRQADLTVCGEAEDAQQALLAVVASRPDLAIVDLTLKRSHGMELIKDLRLQHPKLPVLVLSMHDEALYAERALRAGARGYITKQEVSKKILQAIRAVLAGEIYVSEQLAKRTVQQVFSRSSLPVESPLQQLSDRELEVLRMIGGGLGPSRIAETLGISVKTVEGYNARLKEKLGLASAEELVRYAIELNGTY